VAPSTLSRTHRRDVEELARIALADLAVVWTQVDTGESARDALMDTLPRLAVVYGSAAATLGADYYDEVREAVGARGRFRAIPAELPDRGRTDALARWGVDPIFQPKPDFESAKALVDGGFQRLVVDMDRQTVLGSAAQDPASGRWQRETTGKSCAFCLMLAGRGAVYRADTADFQSHDNCDCLAVPVIGT
jgi:hypothetical protein